MYGFKGGSPFLDTKYPKYSISLLKNSHLDISNLIPASQNFSILVVCFSNVLQFDYVLICHPSKNLENHPNI